VSGFVEEACLIAVCRDCGGVKAIECKPQGDNKLVQEWIARGDIVGAEVISAVRCKCEPAPSRSKGDGG
jgi:hypothetical protein